MGALVISRRNMLVSLAATLPLPSVLRAAQGGSRKDVSWLTEAQQPPPRLPIDAPKLRPVLLDSGGREVRTLDGWRTQRETLRRWWLDFLGRMDDRPKAPPPLTILSEDRPQGVVRQLVRYQVEPGLTTEAYLLKPAGRESRCPGAVVFHETVNQSIRQSAGVEGRPQTAFGLNLARRGFVAICPRNFLWPENGKIMAQEEAERHLRRHPGVRGMAKMLYDGMLAVDILAGLPQVDPSRMVTVGHSLGAKEVLYLAALDERVKAAVSSEGGIGTKFSNWDAPWYLGADIRKESFAREGHEHHELLALVAPRPFLLLGGDSADGDRSWPFIQAAMPVYGLYGGTPRLGLVNHKKGHDVPPEVETQLYEWLEVYG